MNRSSSPFLLYDPEVEKTAKKLRKKAQARKPTGERPVEKGDTSTPIAQATRAANRELREEPKEEPKVEGEREREADQGDESASNTAPTEEMALVDDDPRLCDLTSHEADDPDSPIKLPDGTPSIEIKLPLLGVLPKFNGKPGEDPYNFLNEFTKLCGIQKRPTGVSEETFRLALFSFTLAKEANAWFRRLGPRSMTSWTVLKMKIFHPQILPPGRRRSPV